MSHVCATWLTRVLLVLATLLTAQLASVPAQAQDPMRKHFNEGMKRLAKGDFDGACRYFEASENKGPRVASSYQLGKCNEGRNRFGSAYVAYVRAAKLADKEGDTKRGKVARDRAKEIEPKVARYALVVASPVDGMRIRVDGRTVPREEWNSARAGDDGSHTVEVSAPGHNPSVFEMHTKVGETAKVAIPALKKGKDTTSSSDTTEGGAGGDAAASGSGGAVPPPIKEGDGMKRKSTALFFTGMGLLIAGGIAGIAGGLTYAIDAAESGDDAPEARSIALWVFAVAGIGVGIPFMVVYGKKVPDEPEPGEPTKPAETGVIIEPLVSPTGGGLRVRF
jgi:hypothetical protein